MYETTRHESAQPAPLKTAAAHTPSKDQLIPIALVKAEFAAVSDMTIWRWIEQGIFPRPDAIINKTRYWRRGTLEQWRLDRLNSEAAA